MRVVQIFPRHVQEFFPHSQKHLTVASRGLQTIRLNLHRLFVPRKTHLIKKIQNNQVFCIKTIAHICRYAHSQGETSLNNEWEPVKRLTSNTVQFHTRSKFVDGPSSPHCWIIESGCYDRADAKSTKSKYTCKKIQPEGLTALWPRTNLFYFLIQPFSVSFSHEIPR